MAAEQKGFKREVRSSAVPAINRVLGAIVSGYRTAREVQAGTGLKPITCRTALTKLRRRGRIKRTGFLRYPAETQTMSFYEPVL